MKAWVLHDKGDIRYEDIDIPLLSDGEVRVRVKACGICGSDIPRIYDTGAHNMPIVIGHEFSGVVEGIGRNADMSWLGKRVGLYPLIPCGRCNQCNKGRFEMCRDYDYLGSRRNGGFAEYVAVPASNLINIPDGISFEEAAMLEPMAVAVHAMRRGIGFAEGVIHREDTIALCGLGTIGSLLADFLIEAGYSNLYLIGNSEYQRETMVKAGISEDRYCDSRRQDPTAWLMEKTGGVRLYFECAGHMESLSYGIDSTAPAGRIMIIGNPQTDMRLSRDTYWKILRNQLILTGTWNSSFTCSEDDDWHYVVNRLQNHSIHPTAHITHKFGIETMDEGLSVMRDKDIYHCKVMIYM